MQESILVVDDELEIVDIISDIFEDRGYRVLKAYNGKQALDQLKSDEVIVAGLGEHIFEHFIEAKEIEWDMFRTVVHPWEREQYMSMY